MLIVTANTTRFRAVYEFDAVDQTDAVLIADGLHYEANARAGEDMPQVTLVYVFAKARGGNVSAERTYEEVCAELRKYPPDDELTPTEKLMVEELQCEANALRKGFDRERLRMGVPEPVMREYTVQDVQARCMGIQSVGDRVGVLLERIEGTPETFVGFTHPEVPEHEPAQFRTYITTEQNAVERLTKYLDRYRIVELADVNILEEPTWIEEGR